MTLPTNYADGNTIHGSDVNTWTIAINSLTPLTTSTAASATTITLTNTSNVIQVITGTTTNQVITLPSTSVVAGNAWMVVNNTTGANVTVNASGGATALVLAFGTSAVFTANTATPTTTTGWDIQYGGVSVASGKALTVNNTITLAASADGETFTVDQIPNTNLVGPFGSPSTQTASITNTTNAVQMGSLAVPANSLAAGDMFKIRAFGTHTQDATVSYVVRIGTSNSSADAGFMIANPRSQGKGTHFEALVTIRTVGASGTTYTSGIGHGAATSTSSASISIQNAAVVIGGSAGSINTTATNYIGLYLAVSASTHTNENCYISFGGA